MYTGMPSIDLDRANLTPEQRKIAARIIKSDGTLRASSPTPKPVGTRAKVRSYEQPDGSVLTFTSTLNVYDLDDARAYYVWRHTAFYLSPNSRHQCMPVMDDLYLQDDHDERRAEMKRLDLIVDALVETVPARGRHGLMRWGRALGYCR